MKGFHIHIGHSPPDLQRSLEEGKMLWYSTHADHGWNLFWKQIEPNGYTNFEITIPDSMVTTSLVPNPTKLFKLTRANYKKFSEMYDVTRTSYNLEQLKQDFAGIDANDESLSRTNAFFAINKGPPSGVLWRFTHTGIKIRRLSK